MSDTDPQYKIWFRSIGVDTKLINRYFREKYGKMKTEEIRRRVYQMWRGGMPSENLRKKIEAREEDWMLQDEMSNIHPDAIKTMQERGGQWAAYQNHAFDSAGFGHLQFLKYGIECTYQVAPEELPTDWKYRLVGFVDLTNGVVVPFDSKEE